MNPFSKDLVMGRGYCEKHDKEHSLLNVGGHGCPDCAREEWELRAGWERRVNELEAQLKVLPEVNLDRALEDSLDALSYLLGDPECFCQKHGRFIPAGILKDCPECQAERYFEWKPEKREE